MHIRRRFWAVTIGVALLLAVGFALGALEHDEAPAQPNTSHKESLMVQDIRGTFDVALTPAEDEGFADSPLSRMVLDKEFQGDLKATSIGQMLAARGSAEGSAGYVAMEFVTGSLTDRKGSFVLQHSGTMDRGAQSLTLTVVPDSGTDELEGLEGTMDIIIENGQHFYEFSFSLPKLD